MCMHLLLQFKKKKKQSDKKLFRYRTMISIAMDLSSETVEVRRQWDIVKMLKRK